MVERFKEDEVTAFRQTFQLFDQDRDGVITSREAGDVMRVHGVCISQKELSRLVAQVDKKKIHRVDFPQFLAVMSEKYFEEPKNEDQDLRDAFRVFDPEGNGYISCQELHRILVSLGESFTRKEADRLMLEADTDGDGQISIDEFLDLLCGDRSESRRPRPGLDREATQLEITTEGTKKGDTFITRSKQD